MANKSLSTPLASRGNEVIVKRMVTMKAGRVNPVTLFRIHDSIQWERG